MNTAQRFALNQWLSEYPDWSFDQIIACLKEETKQYGRFILSADEQHDDPPAIYPWEMVEHLDGSYIADLIEDTEHAFNMATEEMLS